jgi:periplasmic divalent cation tolerance protein
MASQRKNMLFEKVDKDAKDIVFVYTTCADVFEARFLGLGAIKEKLAVSADFWVMNSIYPWSNVIQEGEQCMLMFATQKHLADMLMKHIEMEHSYSVPVIIKCDTAMVNQSYHFWVDNTLTSKDAYITMTEEELKRKNEQGYRYDRLK